MNIFQEQNQQISTYQSKCVDIYIKKKNPLQYQLYKIFCCLFHHLLSVTVMKNKWQTEPICAWLAAHNNPIIKMGF